MCANEMVVEICGGRSSSKGNMDFYVELLSIRVLWNCWQDYWDMTFSLMFKKKTKEKK